MIPFFVVDRPMSLNILKTSFVDFPQESFGLMTHAHVTENFLKQFRDFPCVGEGACWLRKRHSCSTNTDCLPGKCGLGSRIRQRIVKMCDYGIFEKEGKTLSYDKLFDRYDAVGANYGVMKDIFGDARATLASARRAVKAYAKKRRPFRLVLVAQGKTVEDYVWCYERLMKLGQSHIAIGGLLRRRPRSARYLYVGSNEILEQVLKAVRKQFNPRWLFVLGVYHPGRHDLLERYGVYGSDYKGWIFNYEHRRSKLRRLHQKLSQIEVSRHVKNALRKARSLRNRLAKIEEDTRSDYVRTRHDSEKNSVRKAAHSRKLVRAQERLMLADQQLFQIRRDFASRDGLPSTYHSTLGSFSRALSQTDQAVRVASVHSYLEKEVYRIKEQ